MHKYTDLLGIKYVPHGRSKQQGFDCHGIAIEVLRRNRIRLPDVGEEFRFAEVSAPEENCIINLSFAEKYSHIGVYIGEGLMIHATERNGVVIEPLRHYEHNVRGFYRIDND